jgi:hypothetical protein
MIQARIHVSEVIDIQYNLNAGLLCPGATALIFVSTVTADGAMNPPAPLAPTAVAADSGEIVAPAAAITSKGTAVPGAKTTET